MARFAKRPPRGPNGGPVTVVADDPYMTTNYPAIWEYLTLELYEDGKRRQRSTLMVMVEDGGVKCCLNDRDNARSLWVTAASLEAALAALEIALAGEDGAGWRYYQPTGKRGKGA